VLFIYLKESAMLNAGESVALRDIAQLAGVNASIKQVKDTALGTLGEDVVLFTAADVAAALNREDVTFLGAPACAVSPRSKQDKKWIKAVKIVFVAALMFVGGAMTVLSYQTDVDMPEAHAALSKIFTGNADTSIWITLPYCIGVGLGVLFFTNVFPSKKKTPSLFELEDFTKKKVQHDFDVSKAEEKK